MLYKFYVLPEMRPMWKMNVPDFPFTKSKNSYPHTHTRRLYISCSLFLTSIVNVCRILFLFDSFPFSFAFYFLYCFIVFCALQIDFDVRPRMREYIYIYIDANMQNVNWSNRIKSNKIINIVAAVVAPTNRYFERRRRRRSKKRTERPKQEQMLNYNLTAVIAPIFTKIYILHCGYTFIYYINISQ